MIRNQNRARVRSAILRKVHYEDLQVTMDTLFSIVSATAASIGVALTREESIDTCNDLYEELN